MNDQPISRLHAVIDSVNLSFQHYPDVWDQRVLDVLDVAKQSVRRHSSIFVLGETVSKAAHEFDGKIEIDFPFMTPFPCTVIEYDAPFDFDLDGKRTGETKWSREVTVLLCSEPDKISSLSFTYVNNRWTPSAFVHEFMVDQAQRCLLCRLTAPTLTTNAIQKMERAGWSMKKAAEVCKADISFMGAFVFQFLQVLQCKNVRQKTNPVPSSLRRKQMRGGGEPGYSFRTLHVDRTEKEQREAARHGDGRHSPRLHLRRGHVRRLSERERTWVSACMVGNEETGEVKKVYAI